MVSLTSTLLLNLAQRVFIEGFPLKRVKSDILPASPIAGRHTNIIHLVLSDQQPLAVRYKWCQESVRPWGNDLPVQCERCCCTRPWSDVVKRQTTLTFTCMGIKIDGTSCTHSISFSPPAKYKKIPGTSWIEIPLM